MIAFKHPDLLERPGVWIFDALRLGRIDGRIPFVPGRTAIGRRAQLDAEMAELQRRESAHTGGVAQHRGHRFAGEMMGSEPPCCRAGAAALEQEQAFASCNGKLHRDPFSAGMSTTRSIRD